MTTPKAIGCAAALVALGVTVVASAGARSTPSPALRSTGTRLCADAVVSAWHVVLSGAGGSSGRAVPSGNGGNGAQVTADIAVPLGVCLTVVLGTAGGSADSSPGIGYGNGGPSAGPICDDGLGGGGSAILFNDTPVLVAGGGGGGGIQTGLAADEGHPAPDGGNAGTTAVSIFGADGGASGDSGGAGGNGTGADGGSSTGPDGGVAGYCAPPPSGAFVGGGGGGGYHGGGGGGSGGPGTDGGAGGGGGSSYLGGDAVDGIFVSEATVDNAAGGCGGIYDEGAWSPGCVGTLSTLGASRPVPACVKFGCGGNGRVSTTRVAVPAVPQNLKTTSGISRISLSWAKAKGASHYNLYRSTSSGTRGTKIATLSAPAYVDTAVAAATTYFYEVSGVSSICEGGASTQQRGSIATVPGPPTSVLATPGKKGLVLSWTAPTSTGGVPLTGYNVYIGTAPGGESGTPANGSSLIRSRTYTVTGLVKGQKYYTVVKAVNGVGSSTASNEASATAK